jgi:hypothetical protein
MDGVVNRRKRRDTILVDGLVAVFSQFHEILVLPFVDEACVLRGFEGALYAGEGVV